jgi:predicted phosphodiesterase
MHQSKRWQEWVGYLVRNKKTSMLGIGDFLNSAIVGSKSDVYDETMTVGEAKRTLRGQLTPLAREGRLDLLMPGNHEQRVTRAVGDCPIEDVAEWLACPYAKSAAWVVYKVGDVEYDFFVRHGTGNGQSMVTLKKGASTAAADVYVTGHVHNQTITADEQFAREGDQVVRRRRYYVSSGSFLSAESYALERGYSPTRIGAPRLYLDGRRKDVHASL